MPIIIITLVLEILAGSFLVSLPIPKATNNKVLGQTVILADDQTPPSDQTPAPADNNPAPNEPTPTDQTQPAPDQSVPSENQPDSQPPIETQSPVPTSRPPEAAAPAPESPSSASPETETSPISSPEAQTSAKQTPEESASASADLPILNTDELINNASQIDPKSQEEAATEDSQLAAMTDPTVKAAALATFASDKISDIDRFTRSEDWSSITFAGQRLSDQIDQLKTLSSQTPADGQIQQKLSDLCQQASTTLRTNQEIVPEELEQDLEITRGQCLGY